ncbi:MAG: glycoside hydrolase family 15 protein [Halobacteriales archaeon]|nr:glycoside hydrolase family 15 protein [Halobacteriales archaeon]
MIAHLTGNTRILLCIDERGAWSDLYYPYPGLHQQLQQTRVGLYDVASGDFEWMGQGAADPEVSSIESSDGARTRLAALGLDVQFDDAVHPNIDLILRRIKVANNGPERRAVRLFHYQSLNIAGSLYQGTAYWDEARRTVNHYKGDTYFQFMGRPDFDHWSCGEHTLKGLRGSYVDAEDGSLQGNAISHGAADSVVQWNLDVPPGGERLVHLLLMVGHSRRQVNEMQRVLAEKDPALYLAETVGYGNHWAARAPPHDDAFSPRVAEVYRRSLFVMRDCQASTGAIVASPDSRTLNWGGDTYNYCWWRDGAYVSMGLSEAGLGQAATRFLRFAAQCQEEEGYFLHRHLPDGALGSTWHPPPFLQVDQTASVVEAVRVQYEASGDLDGLLASWPMVRSAADWLMRFVDADGLPLPSFDLWEERKGVNTYSVAAVVRGLEAAGAVGKALAKRSDFWAEAAARMRESALARLWNPAKATLLKGVRDETIDASALLALQMGLLAPADPRYAQVVQAVERRLWVAGTGGVARYEEDQYYGLENPWIICTLWLAQCHLALGARDRAKGLIEWCASQASPTHLLPEQLDARTGEHASVTPLVWSHSTFVQAVGAYRRRPLPAGPPALAVAVKLPGEKA